MTLHYLIEVELEMSRDEVNLQIVLGLQSVLAKPNCTKEDIYELFDDIRAHELYLQIKARKERALQEIQKTLDFMAEMEVSYAELKKIPWYRFSERKAVKQKIDLLRRTLKREVFTMETFKGLSKKAIECFEESLARALK